MTYNHADTKNLRIARRGEVAWQGKTYFSLALAESGLTSCLVEVKELNDDVLTVEASGLTLHLKEVCYAKAFL